MLRVGTEMAVSATSPRESQVASTYNKKTWMALQTCMGNVRIHDTQRSVSDGSAWTDPLM